MGYRMGTEAHPYVGARLCARPEITLSPSIFSPTRLLSQNI